MELIRTGSPLSHVFLGFLAFVNSAHGILNIVTTDNKAYRYRITIMITFRFCLSRLMTLHAAL